MATSPAPVLDLTSEEERPRVRIGGRTYQLRLPTDLSLEEFTTVTALARRIAELSTAPASGKAAKAQMAELAAHLKELCDVVLDAPAAIKAKLGDVRRMMVFRFFTTRSLPGLEAARASLAAVLPSAGEKPSPASNGSTADRPRDGSPRSRSGR